MMPKVFKDLIQACNDCIVDCEECIRHAEKCEKSDAGDQTCLDFIAQSKECCESAEVCIKACDAMIAEFKNEGHQEHMEILNATVKELGEHNRILGQCAENCRVDKSCPRSCAEAKEACNRVVKTVDECIESCEKHVVYYEHIKKY